MGELITFKVAINEAAKLYDLPFLTAALQLVNDIKTYNKMDGLKKELSALYLQKYTINEFCSRHSQSIMALLKLQTHGVTEYKILYLNNLLGNNRYNIDMISRS
jgi:hypothetical protein